jgi:oligopeptide transport system ATP-binding protein
MTSNSGVSNIPVGSRAPQPSNGKELTPPLLSVRDLKVHFPGRGGLFSPRSVIRAVDGVSFEIKEGETYGLVGESGCGKSTTARAVVGLVRPTAGEVHLNGRRIDGLSDAAMRPHRATVQMIFQDPMASLNPRMTVGQIIAEPMQILGLCSRGDQQLEALRLMQMVGLNPRFLNRYPHEFSGGQRQRVGIARALAVRPKLIVCDEPISALDVSIQAQVINLLMDLQDQLGLAYLFIAHDLAVVRHIARRVGVMYLGRIVESAEAAELFSQPKHPYTQALLSAAPLPDPRQEHARQRIVLQGEVPSPDREYSGCPFADRCPIVEALCRQTPPTLIGESHAVSCFRA